MRIIFVLAILIIDLFANSSEIETKIYEKIISNFDKNSEIKVYSNDKNILNEIKKYSKKLVVSNKKDSKVYILSTNIGNIPDDKLVIVTNYELLKEIKNSLAAFYWKKGRPNILFIKDRIKKRNLFLNKEYDKYSEEERCLYELCF
jgi:sugar-specific transcriptional regulator TrmB